MRCSTTGYMYMSAGGAISWTSKHQPMIALSTAETKYMSIMQVAKEAFWLTNLLQELDIRNTNEPLIIPVNNQ